MTVSKDVHTDSQLPPLNQRKPAPLGGVRGAGAGREGAAGGAGAGAQGFGFRDRPLGGVGREPTLPLAQAATLVVALAWTPEPIPEQVVADQLGEGPRPLAPPVATDRPHRDARVVVEYPTAEHLRRS